MVEPWAEFEDAITPHLNHLRTYCRYLTASTWEAEDLLQDTLLRTFSHYRKRGEVRYPRTLLYKIARNLHIDAHRRRRGRVVPIDEAIDEPHHDRNYASIRGLLEWVAEHLSEREVEMLLLAEVFRYSYQDIADRLHCTVPAVKMVLHRSKQHLRREGRGAGTDADRPAASSRKSAIRKPRRPVLVDRWTSAVMNFEQ